MIDLRAIARALGGNVAGRNSVVAPGPGHSPHDRSLSVRLDSSAPDGFIVNSFAGDDWSLCRDYVRERLGLPEWQPGDEQNCHVPPSREHDRMAMNHQPNNRSRTEEDLERIARAVKLWNEGRDPKHTIVEDYLRSRSLDLPHQLAGNVLRYHPRCPWRNESTGATERIPALIAAFRSFDDDQITAVHLDPLGGTTLCIGEGVETSLAARQLGLTPTWALGSVGAISFFPLISRIKNLTILGETGSASKEATRLCARRWRHGFRHVQVAMPEVGSDLNDALMMGNSR